MGKLTISILRIVKRIKRGNIHEKDLALSLENIRRLSESLLKNPNVRKCVKSAKLQ